MNHSHLRKNVWLLKVASFWFKYSAARPRNMNCAADFIIDTEPKEG